MCMCMCVCMCVHMRLNESLFFSMFHFNVAMLLLTSNKEVLHDLLLGKVCVSVRANTELLDKS